ncbi:MAG: DMT family transporter [Saprospiraceae bacterium]|jgi:drug/metabolite transporter (DMT)-like permease|nr:DMT family transporter [Saprospiraceae bacterium]
MKAGRALLQIHIAVFFFGIAGLFGKFVAVPAMMIVLGRAFFASIAIGVGLLLFRQSVKLGNAQNYAALLGLGAILALHWWSFFYAIQVSTVAVGLVTFSTFPVFTALLEPLYFKEPFRTRPLLLAALTFFGVVLVVPEYRWENQIFQGAVWGVVSGFTFSILSILNRAYVRRYSSFVIAFYQDLGASLVLLPLLLWTDVSVSPTDFWLLVLLGVVFTALSHGLFINGLRSVNAASASIIGSLEPVYGIVGALLLLGEVPSMRTIVGGLIILGVSVVVSVKN